MARLEDISVGELEDALANASEKKETMRLLVAIIYKRGPSVPMIAEWLDLREATIYRWFDRLEEEPIEEAVQDRTRPGRPSKLTDNQRDELAKTLGRPPSAAGYDQDEWTPELTRQFVAEEFGVEYTLRHVQRLVDELER